MKKFFFIFFLFSFNVSIWSVSIETVNKKNFNNVKILKQDEKEIEFLDENGLVNKIDRTFVSSIKENSNPPTTAILSQTFGNELVFQGVPLYGDRLARRNGESYSSFNQGYNVMTNISLQNLPKGLEIDLASANPLVGRSNTDRDLNFQTVPGGISQNQLVVNSINSGNLLYDPNGVKIRNENNRLLDYIFTRFHYNHETKLGIFGLGAVTIHTTDPAYSMRFLYAISWKMPFLQYLNPNVVMYTNMLNEANGFFQGTRNVRFNLFHKYEIDKDFSITPSITVGYADANNNTSRQKGINDITTNIKFSYLNYFLTFNHVRRSDILFDNNIFFPVQGGYSNTIGDGMIADPSRVHGYQNSFITNQISQNISDENLKKHVINNYQNQRIIKDIFYIAIGYTLKF